MDNTLAQILSYLVQTQQQLARAETEIERLQGLLVAASPPGTSAPDMPQGTQQQGSTGPPSQGG